MNFMRSAVLLTRGIRACERALRRLSEHLARYGEQVPGSGSRYDKPNNPDQWEAEYLKEVRPILRTCHPVALKLIELSSVSEVLLETGCGSAEISAQLALTGRITVLADFSEHILDRARRVYEASTLSIPECVKCDLTQKLPLASRDVDIVWSSGVLEHWTDEELVPIVSEMRRVAKKKVISFVPHAGCLLYRFAKHEAERLGRWPYGRELPRSSLRKVFEGAGLHNVQETVVWEEAAPGCVSLFDGALHNTVRAWWDSLPIDDEVKKNQGYLLCTVGDVAPKAI